MKVTNFQWKKDYIRTYQNILTCCGVPKRGALQEAKLSLKNHISWCKFYAFYKKDWRMYNPEGEAKINARVIKTLKVYQV